jgi:hypothetical protein
MKRPLWVGAAALGGFAVTFGAIFLYWYSGRDSTGCSGEECVLEYAAVVTWGIIIGVLLGVSCGFVVYVLTGRSAE